MVDFSGLRGFQPGRSTLVEEDAGGIIATILDTIKKDVQGAAKTAVAVPGELLGLVGVETSLTFDDLTSRDLVGAASIASMFVGGGVAAVANSLRAGRGVRGAALIARSAATKEAKEAALAFARQQGKWVRAGQLAASEAAAGAFFGAVKPLEDAESRLEEVLTDATLLGAAGGGLSLLGSAWRSSFGAKIAILKGQTRAQLLSNAAQKREGVRALTEFAGVQLQNPETGVKRKIHRLADGRVRIWDGVTASEADDFGAAVARSIEEGYTDHLGLSRSKLGTAKLPKDLPEELVSAFDEASGELTAVIDSTALGNYRAVRDAATKHADSEGLLAWLGAETVTPMTDEFGVVSLDSSVGRKFKNDVLQLLPKNMAKKLGAIDNDAEFFRQAVMAGAVDVESLATGRQMSEFADDLIFRDQVPVNPDGSMNFTLSARNPYDAGFMSKLATASTMAKIHPEIAPLTQLGDVAANAQSVGSNDQMSWMMNLENRVGGKAAVQGMDIIEASAEAGGIAASRKAAREAASATGDAQVIDFVNSATERLNTERLRLIGVGQLGGSDADPKAVGRAREAIARMSQGVRNAETPIPDSEAAENLLRQLNDPVVNELLDDAGLAGYFPIVNTGGIQAHRSGEIAPNFFDNWNDAVRWVAQGGKGGTIVNGWSRDSFNANVVTPKEFGRLVNAVREVSEVKLSAKEVADLLMEGGTLPSNGPRKFSRFTQKRRLGVRDYADDPFRSLRAYLLNTERVLAYNTFEREANRVIDNLPAAKTALKRWAEDQRDLQLGRQTGAEKAFLSIMQSVAPGMDAAKLHKYSATLRHIQGVAKLGGVWSGLINTTQYLVNTVPVLGARWAARGAEATIRGTKAHDEVFRLLAKHEKSIGLHVNLTREGRVIGAEKFSAEVQAAVSRARLGEGKKAAVSSLKALENIWMWSFNQAERQNRLGTFWGAFQKGSFQGMDERSAVDFALEIVNRTQFDYGVNNIPQALQGPVGSVLGQFKTFFINEVELIASVDNATRAKIMGMIGALGGASALLEIPGVDLADMSSRLFFDNKISEELTLAGGPSDAPNVTRLTAFGLPGLLNIDFSNYVGPGGIGQMTQGLLGPTVSDAKGWVQFAAGAMKDIKASGHIQQPTVNLWMQRVMPAQIRRIQRGMLVGSGRDLFQLGAYAQTPGEVRNPYSGKLLYRPEARMAEAVGLAIGAPLIRTTIERTQDDIIRRETDAYRGARESYRRQIAIATMSGRGADAQALRTRAAAAGITFTGSDMRRAVESFSKTAAERRRLRTPVALRTEFEDFYEIP